MIACEQKNEVVLGSRVWEHLVVVVVRERLRGAAQYKIERTQHESSVCIA